MNEVDFSLALRKIVNVPWVLRNRLMALASALQPKVRTNIVSALAEAEKKECDIVRQGCEEVANIEQQAAAASRRLSAHAHA